LTLPDPHSWNIEKGLPPLPDLQDVVAKLQSPGVAGSSKDSATAKPQLQGLSFSSSSRIKTSTGKRKAVGQPEEEKEGNGDKDKKKKKAKKSSKTLLSFDDEA